MMRRIMSMLLALVMVVGMLPATALSAEETETVEETTAAETSAPVVETTPPIEETTAPTGETEAPAEETVAPTEETAAPTEEVTEPTEEVQTLVADAPAAQAVTDSGTCGDNLNWIFDEAIGALTISGSGEMYDWKIWNQPWNSYSGQIRKVILEEGVTSVGDCAFYDCDSLTDIILPSTVTVIQGSFEGCDALTSVTIPATVEVIAYDAFRDCTSLTEITFEHDAQASLSIQYDSSWSPFYVSSETATTIYVPYADNVNSAISGYDWSADNRVVTYQSTAEVPVTAISIRAQDDIAAVEAGIGVQFEVTFEPWNGNPKVIWEIDTENSTGNAEIDENGVLVGTQPGIVTVRAVSVFDASVSDETQIQILPASAYVSAITVRCDGEFESELEVGTQVRMIADIQPGNAANKTVVWEVENGTGTASITESGVLTGLTPGTVTVYATATDGTEIIGSRVVEVVRYVEDITIYLNGKPDVVQIGLNEPFVISASVTPEDANYTEVIWLVENGTGSAGISDSMLTGTAAGTVTLKAIAQDSRSLVVSKELTVVGEEAAYAVTGGNIYYNTVTGAITGSDSTVTVANIPGIINGTQITSIAPDAFCKYSYSSRVDNTTLTSVTIPSSVTEIGDYAFYGCTAMTSLKFGSNSQLTMVGKRAFCGCENLASLTIPDSVVSIGESAFYGLTNLKSLTLSGELDTTDWLTVGGYVNDEWKYPETLTLTGEKVISQPYTDYGDGSYSVRYWEERNAANIILSDSIKIIEPYAFHGHDGIINVTFGSGLEEIGNCAFKQCSGLTQIALPESLASVGKDAFAGCNALTSATLPEGLLSIGDSAFEYCRNLVSINLPESLTSIGKACFAGCDSLQLIDLSAVPDVIMQKSTELNPLANIPSVLVSATGGQVKLSWDISDLEGDYSEAAYQVAAVYGYGSGEAFLEAFSTGTVLLHCWDSYTGAHGSKIISVEAGVVIDAGENPGYLVSGKTLQLTALQMPDESKADVAWSSSNTAYATVSSSGKVTAQSVANPVQVTITAQPYNGGDAASLTLWILPKNTGLTIYEEGTETEMGSVRDVEMSVTKSLSLSVRMESLGEVKEITWSSSNKDIAIVDQNGLVQFLKPGTVIITAKDVYGTSVSLTLNITYIDTAGKLTAEPAAVTLQPTQTAVVQVSGSEQITAEKLTFVSSNDAVAVVDASGIITAVSKGTATITASLTGDPLGRSAQMKVTVIAPQTASVLLRPVGDFADLERLDVNGNVTDSEAETVKYAVYMNQADVRQGIYTTFHIVPNAVNSLGETMELDASSFKWASSNTKVAAVKANADGSATVTVKKTAEGACVITAVSTDLARLEQELVLHVRDFAPRLEAASFTMNTKLSDAVVTTALVESYGNTIEEVGLYAFDKAAGSYAAIDYMTASYADGILTITPKGELAAGTYKLMLGVRCANGGSYEFDIKVVVKNTTPSVTVKQPHKFNLFYTDSEATLRVTAKNAVVTGVELADTNDFELTYDEETGASTVRFSETYDPAQKPDTKGTLLVSLAGYGAPVEKAVTIATTTAKPKLALSPASGTVNTALASEHTASFAVYDKTTGLNLPLTAEDVTILAAFGAEYDVIEDQVCIYLTGETGGTANVQIQLDNWSQSIAMTYKITVTDKLPAVKLGTTTLKLNRIFTWQEAASTVTLSQSNLEIGWFDDFVSATAEGEKIRVEYDGENIIAAIIDPEDAPKAGTYSFTAVPYLSDGTALKAVTVKVNVGTTAPKVKLTSSALKLNKVLYGNEAAATGFTLTKGEGYTLVGFKELDELNDENVQLTFVDGMLMAELVSEDAATKKYTFNLTPILEEEATGQRAELSSKVKLNVQVYSNERISVSLSSKGKLDAINPDSAITYTVKKISNAVDTIEESDITLTGEHGDLFTYALDQEGKILLKMIPGQVYATNQTYKVQFAFNICGREVASSVLSFKVTQSALKFSLPKVCSFYQSQTNPLKGTISLTSPEGASLSAENITINTGKSAAFLQVLGSDGLEVTVSEDGRSAELTFDIRNPGRLTHGKSYTVYLDILPESCASNLREKPTQIKLTVKVLP